MNVSADTDAPDVKDLSAPIVTASFCSRLCCSEKLGHVWQRLNKPQPVESDEADNNNAKAVSRREG